MVKVLLEDGADVNARRLYDADALFDAVQDAGGNGSAIICLLASHGAKLDLNNASGGGYGCTRNIALKYVILSSNSGLLSRADRENRTPPNRLAGPSPLPMRPSASLATS